jgi:hypothetical protein
MFKIRTYKKSYFYFLSTDVNLVLVIQKWPNWIEPGYFYYAVYADSVSSYCFIKKKAKLNSYRVSANHISFEILFKLLHYDF